MGDRDDIALLDKPNGMQTGQYIKFKETAFVIGEKKDWIQIAIGSKDKNKFRNIVKSGWVKKVDVLLWSKSLRDDKTWTFVKANVCL